MSNNKNEILDISLETPTENIPLDKSLIKLEEFRKWINDHPEYPQKITDAMLLRYLKVNDNEIEKAQKLLEYNLTLRKSAPQLFTNRDFFAEEIQNATNVMEFCPLPKLTKEKYRITIGGFRHSDASKFDYVNCIKMVLMLFDTRFSDYDADGIISEGEISIMDMKNMTWRHLMKAVANMMTAKIYSKFVEDATPMKIIQLHVVNPSIIVHKLFTIFKTFVKQELIDLLHFHNSLDSLYEHVPRELLPVEWGGSEEITIEEVRQEYMKKMEKFRDFLLDDDNWKISEKKDKNQEDEKEFD